MPRYFFHTQSDTRLSDDVGVDLLGPLQARHEAIRSLGEMLEDFPQPFWGSRPWTVTVTDDTGLVLWEINVDGTASAAAPPD